VRNEGTQRKAQEEKGKRGGKKLEVVCKKTTGLKLLTGKESNGKGKGQGLIGGKEEIIALQTK